MDCINGLADEVICHILSFLVIKESAITCVLSKRWRDLFALRSNLHLDDQGVTDGGESFIDFVDSVLSVSRDFPMRNISITCRSSSIAVETGHVTRWMTDVVKHGVVNLNIDVVAEDVILVPLEIFTCKTLVELKLAKGFDAMVPDHVDLPSLKTLYLDSIYFYNSRYCVLEKLLSACPLLEELTILGDYWQDRKCSRIVASSTLKKLTIKCSDTCLDYWNMTLDTPSLVYLEYSDLVPRSYPIVNLASLVEAKLHLRLGWDPTNLIQGLTNVESLTIDDNSCREFFSSDHGEAIPVFINLSRLSIVFGSLFYSWEFLPLLLNKTPNLHTLAIKGPLCADYCDREYGFSSVKVLKISVYSGEIKELAQMKRLLEKLPCLELVKVRAYAITDEEKSRITKDLLMLPRSSMCNIQIKFCDKAIIPRLRLIFGVYDNNV